MDTEQVARHANERGCSACLIGVIIKMNLNGLTPVEIMQEMDRVNADGWAYYRPHFVRLIEKYNNP